MRSRNTTPQFRIRSAAFAAAAIVGVLGVNANAQTVINWTGSTSTDWATGSNWQGGTAPSNDLTGNIAGFDSATYSFQPLAPNSRAIAGIQVGASSAAVTINTGGGGNRMRIGSSGITMESGAGALSLGVESTDGVVLGASQTWQNNSASLLGWNSMSTLGNLGAVTLTLSGSGSGGFDMLQNSIGEGTGSTLAIDVDYSGSGVVSLDNSNITFSGGLNIKRGNVVVNISSPGTGAVTLGSNGGSSSASLTSANASTPRTFTNAIVLASGHTGDLTIGMNSGNGNATFTGGVTGTNNLIVDSVGTGTGVLVFTTSGLNFTGNLTKKGGKIASLSAANTFGGIALVEAGTLRLDHIDALQNATLDTGTSGAQAVTFGIAGTNTYNIGGLQGSDALAIGDNTISVGANNANTSFSGGISGTGGALTKTGSGRLTLASTNTYTGATSVLQGVLLVDGTTAAGSAVSVSSGAVFGGNGTVGGNLTLASGALFAFDTGSTLDLSGTLALDPFFDVDSLRSTSGSAVNWASVAQGTYTLMNTSFTFNTGNIQDFGPTNQVSVAPGKSAYFQQGSGPSSLQLVVVPEPAALGLTALGMGLAGVACWRRRRG
jgi:autotransporter-associated beta strand protein